MMAILRPVNQQTYDVFIDTAFSAYAWDLSHTKCRIVKSGLLSAAGPRS